MTTRPLATEPLIGRPELSAANTRPINPWAVSAFVLSLFAWQGFVIAFISASLARIALKQIKERGEGGRPMAQFARALGILFMIVMLTGGDYPAWPAHISHYPLWPR
jgi:hypothetical protein